jgi:hypothetical protein
MTCVICTLFERHYHFGLAAFVNTICSSGFRGTIYAGYRGPLPPWAGAAQTQANGHAVLEVTPDVRLIFVPLETTAHLANYKPTFLLQVEALMPPDTEAVIYADPDLLFEGKWKFIVDWLSCGLAVCEDINSPMAENHPARVGWRRSFHALGHNLRFRTNTYANSGFIGYTRANRGFVPVWKEFLAYIAEQLGGDDVAGIVGGKRIKRTEVTGFGDCFAQPDQDAFNAVLEACPDIPLSFLGPEAMGFRGRRAILPHSVGFFKPWTRPFLKHAYEGRAPTLVDKTYWNRVNGPLRPYTAAQIASAKWRLRLAAAVGRFYRRN